MTSVLWTLVGIVAYVGGLFLILRFTPKLTERSYDEGLFMGIAALAILGAILAFGAVLITYLISNGVVVKVLDFILLVGILIVGIRTCTFSLRTRFVRGTFRASRIIAGIYSLCLAIAALYYIIQIFVPS